MAKSLSLSFLLLLLQVAGCRTEDPPTVVCPAPGDDLPELALPAPDACRSGRVLVDAIVPRRAGSPETADLPFHLPRDGTVCLELRSPAEADELAIASATILLDGDPVLAPRDFSRHASVHREERALGAGPHLVSVRLRSTPTATLRVIARYAEDDRDARLAQARAVADLEHAACNEFNRTVEALPLDQRQGLIDDLLALGLAPGHLITDVSAYGTPSRLAPLPVMDLGVPSDAGPEERALAWIERHREIFRSTDPELELRALPARTQPAGAHRVEVRGRWRGMDVEGLTATLLVDADGHVRSITGVLTPEIIVALEPVVSAAEAANLASAATALPATGEPTLEVVDLAGLQRTPGTLLAWLVHAGSSSVRIDAVSGRVISLDGVREFDVILARDRAREETLTQEDRDGILRELDLEVQIDTTDRFQRTGPCNPSPCLDVLAPLSRTNFFFVEGLGRDGWSDGGNGLSGLDAIPAGAPYTVVYDARDAMGNAAESAFFDRTAMGVAKITENVALLSADGAFLSDQRLISAVALPPGWVTDDVVTHECGHGMLDTHLQNRVGEASSCWLRTIHEHTADTLAVLADGFFVRPIEQQLVLEAPPAAPTAFRDHRFEDPPPMLTGCAARHLTQAARHQDGMCPVPHEESCLLTKLWALTREADLLDAPLFYHGVTVEPGIGFDVTKQMFHEFVRLDLSAELDFIAYGFAYQTLAARRVAACRATGTCPPSFARRLSAPMWAVGFWSDEQVLGTGHDTVVSPAAAARDGSVWVFFVPPPGPAGAVHVYRDDDVLDITPGEAVPLSDLGVILPATASGLAAARTDDLVTLALIADGGTEVVVASTRSPADPTWRSALLRVPLEVQEGAGALAVGHAGVFGLGGRSVAPVVVAQVTSDAPFNPPELAYFTQSQPAPRLVPGSLRESAPALVPLVVGFELWSIFEGNLRRRTGSVTAAGSIEWSAPREISVPVDAPGGSNRDGAIPGEGLVVQRFLTGSPHIYVQRTAGMITHHVEDVIPASNFVPIRGRYVQRPAAFVVTAPDGIPAQVLLTVGSDARMLPNRLVFQQQRSN